MQATTIQMPSARTLLLEALERRYAVRRFADQPLFEQDVAALMHAVSRSASSYGLQPYRVVLVSARDVLRELVPHSYGQDKVMYCSHLAVLAVQTDLGDDLVDAYLARVLVQRGGDPDALRGYGEHIKQALGSKTPAQRLAWAHEQTYLALGTLLISAALLGIDSCPMGGIDPAGYDAVLGLAEQALSTSVVCALGRRHPLDKSASSAKVRVPVAELVRRV